MYRRLPRKPETPMTNYRHGSKNIFALFRKMLFATPTSVAMKPGRKVVLRYE